MNTKPLLLASLLPTAFSCSLLPDLPDVGLQAPSESEGTASQANNGGAEPSEGKVPNSSADGGAEPEPMADARARGTDSTTPLVHPGGTFSSSALGRLRGVTVVSGDLQLDSYVSDLSDLESLSSVSGNLSVSNNDALTSLQGLESLTSVGGDLILLNAYALTSLEGLQSLTSVGSLLRIGYTELTSLDGLESLTSVGGSLEVRNNPALTSLEGLQSLTSVGGSLEVRSNPAVTSLEGLQSLTSVGGDLAVSVNSALAPCWVSWLLDGVTIAGQLVANYGNGGGGGCTSPR